MPASLTRRAVLASAAAILPARAFAAQPVTTAPPSDSFPSQDLSLVRDMVGASHGKLDRVTALLKEAPRFANATYDWGFGDWETALGAASHVGNREIAALLLDHGARPDLFTFAMLGNLDAVKAAIAAQPGLQKTRGPHGLTLLHHARQGGDQSAAVVEFLTSIGDADIPYQDLPLTDSQRTIYAGEYSFGPSESQRFKVSIREKDKNLTIQRTAGNTLRLFHQGDHSFHPPGAPEVRITFTVESDRAASMAITSPAPVLTANRL
jgi:hypothetical protein